MAAGGLDVVPEGLPLLLSGLGMLGVAVAILLIDRASRLNRAFAGLLVLRGGVNALTALRISSRVSPEEHAFAFRTIPFFAVAVIPAALYFMLVFVGRPGFARWRRSTLAALALAALALEALLLVDPDLYRSAADLAPSFHDGYGPLYLVSGGSRLAYAVVALVLAREHVRAPPAARKVGLLLASAGFALDPAFLGLYNVVTYDVAGLWPRGVDAWFVASHVLEDLALVPLVLLVGTLAREATRAPTLAARRDARVYAFAFAGPVLSALAILSLSPPFSDVAAAATIRQQTYDALDGLWTLTLPALVGYGLAKRQVFSADVKLRWTVKAGTILVMLVVVFFTVSFLAQLVVDTAIATTVAFLAAGALLIALPPLRAIADRAADAIVPAARDEDHLNERKLEVYRSALETAVSEDGTLLPEHERMLATLRTKLGITDRDHHVLAYAVRSTATTRSGETAAASAPVERVGDTILGRYRLSRLLGEGGHGRTHLAEDTVLKREVVVKTLRSDDAEAALREARAMAAVRSPHVVTLYDVERQGDRVILVMEHAERGSLADAIRSPAVGAGLQGRAFAQVAIDLLDGLDAVHAAHTVHRDVKPSNVLLTADGRAKLADFGVARLPGVETTIGALRETAPGTARFMSPEQARGKRVTARSDLFSAAATLYEAWTGQPYLAVGAGESTVEVRMHAAAARAFDKPFDGPPEVRAWLARALDPSPDARFASAREMRDAMPLLALTNP